MRVVVVGGGADGSHLAERLVAEGDEVAVVELDGHRASELRDRLDAQVIEGNGANPSVLKRAGISKAELLFAVTDDDGTNVLACQTGRALGLERTIARIENTELRDVVLGSGVEAVIDPRAATADKIVGLVAHPGLSDYFRFCEASVVVLGGVVAPESRLVGLSLADMRRSLRGWDCVIASIVRAGETLVGRGGTVVEAYDKIIVVVEEGNVEKASDLIGATPRHIGRAVVVGGGRVATLTAAALRRHGIRVTLIHDDADRAHTIAERYSKIDVIVADATDPRVLQRLDIGSGDAFLSLTRSDAINVLSSLIAGRLGASSTVARYNRMEVAGYMETVGIDATVSTKVAAANAALRFVRRGAIISAADFATGGIEALEVEIPEEAPARGIAIKDLPLPEGAVVGAILRRGRTIVPLGSSRFEAGDRVVVLATPDAVRSIERLFGE